MSEKIKYRCTKYVSDSSGFHFYPCNRPAKFRLVFDDGREPKYRCGIHAKRLNVFATKAPL